MSQEYEAIVDMRNMGFLHVQRQFELTFKETSACFSHCFRVRPGSFYDHHKIISVTAVRYCRYPLSVLPHGNRSPIGDTEVPHPPVLAHFLAEVVRLHPSIEFVQHDVGKQRGNHPALRTAFDCGSKQTVINASCLDEFPEQCQQALIGDTFSDSLQEKTVMNGVKVVGEITFVP